jgi:HK97 gp10 family phage protein
VISISVTGAEAIARKFATAAAVVPAKALPSGLDKCGLLVLRRAKQKAPVDTGNLRALIEKPPATMTEVDVVSPAEYSIYLEMGTHKMAAQPYMRPALDESKDQIEELLGHSVIATIESVMY